LRRGFQIDLNKDMTDAAVNVNENGTEESAEVESGGDGSDAGSEIFMPGGITMKSPERPSDIAETDTVLNEKDVYSDNEKAISKDNVQIKNDMSVDDKEPKAEEKCEETKDKEKERSEPNKEELNDDDKSVDSPSSCLEMNIDDESAFPRSDKEKSINIQRTNSEKQEEDENFEDRNIFANIFEEEKPQKAGSDDEHNMSDDFKIGLNQKSYEEDPFCPDKPPVYETIENNNYLIDK
jgi:hypothetical protein